MNCAPFDLKDYFFGELSDADQRRMRAHVETCRACGDELDRLELTRAALHSLPDEEIPRRIAFVSDNVFEPPLWRRLWRSGPVLGFASTVVLAGAILVHGLAAPRAGAPPAIDQAAVESLVSAEVTRRLEPAVQAAVTGAAAREAKKTEEMIAAARREFALERQADRVAVAESLNLLQKRYNILYTKAEFGGDQ